MHVQRVHNTTFTSGIYFSKASNICFDKTAEFLNPKGIVKTSESGYKYIEDIEIPRTIKYKFLENNFVRKIGEKFDTFIWFKQTQPDTNVTNSHFAMAKIYWADMSKAAAQTKQIIGTSRNSVHEALDKMFQKLNSLG